MLTTVRIGGIEVVSLLDGVEDLDDPDILDPWHGPSDPVWEPSRARYPAVFAADGGWRLYVRATLLRAHGHTILVDTGVGGPTSPAMAWYPAPGQLLGSLAEAGTSPHDVDVVVLTHVHDDHIGGTVTAQGEPAFQNARYLVNRIDLAWQEELAQRFDEDRAIWDRLLAPLRSRGVLQAIDGDHEITQGVHAARAGRRARRRPRDRWQGASRADRRTGRQRPPAGAGALRRALRAPGVGRAVGSGQLAARRLRPPGSCYPRPSRGSRLAS